MGTPGVPLTISKATIAACIKKHKGVVTYICKELNIHHSTFLIKVRADPELVEELSKARNAMSDEMCDLAENALIRAVTQEQDLSSAISSAKFILNNKGKDRGYAPIVHGIPTTDPRLDAIDGNSTDLVSESK